MIGHGHIIKSTPHEVIIATLPQGGCRDCSVVGACEPGKRLVYITAAPYPAVNNGDIVEFEIPPIRSLISAFTIFILPLIAFFTAFFISAENNSENVPALRNALVACIIALVIMLFIEKTIARFLPRPFIRSIIARHAKSE